MTLKDYECRPLNTEVAVGDSDAILTQIYEFSGGHKMRLKIRSNAYRFQCSAKIERHDGAQWHELARIEPMAMETPHGLVYGKRTRGELMRAFDADRETLLDQATLTLLL